MRIIGCGNRQRGDDAAGILVAERLNHLGIQAEICCGQATDLIEAWSGPGDVIDDDVIVVDAVVTGAPVGTVLTWDAAQAPIPVASSASTHGLGLAEAIELARVLGRLPAHLRIYAIEGKCFEPGSQISPELCRAVEDVVRRIMNART